MGFSIVMSRQFIYIYIYLEEIAGWSRDSCFFLNGCAFFGRDDMSGVHCDGKFGIPALLGKLMLSLSWVAGECGGNQNPRRALACHQSQGFFLRFL